MRQFTGCPQQTKVRWDPQVFSFWEDISLFKIAKEYDLFRWPEGCIGGFRSGVMNPDTRILVFPYCRPPSRSVSAIRNHWKDAVRESVKSDLLLRCGRLFTPRKDLPEFTPFLRDQVAITCAELVVNAVLHGRTSAFVGLQRSRTGITVVVCDSGRGFLASINERLMQSGVMQLRSNLQALALGSLLNLRQMGLRGAIDSVVRHKGYVFMSSFKAEIRWSLSLWDHVVSLTPCDEDALVNKGDVSAALGEPSRGRPSEDDLNRGYCRTWEFELRGSRIAFEIPFSKFASSW